MALLSRACGTRDLETLNYNMFRGGYTNRAAHALQRVHTVKLNFCCGSNDTASSVCEYMFSMLLLIFNCTVRVDAGLCSCTAAAI